MSRRAAGLLVGWGLFLSVASFFAIALTVVRFGVLPAGLLGLVVGALVGVGARHGVDRAWPDGIDDPRPDAPESPRLTVEPVRYRYRPDMDDTLTTLVPELFADWTTDDELRMVASHRASRGRRAGAR